MWDTPPPPPTPPQGDCTFPPGNKAKAQHVPIRLQPATSAPGLGVWRPPVDTLLLAASTVADAEEKPGSSPQPILGEPQIPWESWDPEP